MITTILGEGVNDLIKGFLPLYFHFPVAFLANDADSSTVFLAAF